ncbi:MAG: AAA family ATPase [Acidobacteriota bacterium]|nr:AAA family ATPase [Acidobacteriota bacterium]
MYFGGEATLPGNARADAWSALFANPWPSARPLRQLSRGTRQLVGLTACLSRDDWAVGLLDEPWEGLDPDASGWLAGRLERHAARGASVLISSHRLHDVAGTCTSFAFLANGTLRFMRASDLAPESGQIDAACLASVVTGAERRA